MVPIKKNNGIMDAESTAKYVNGLKTFICREIIFVKIIMLILICTNVNAQQISPLNQFSLRTIIRGVNKELVGFCFFNERDVLPSINFIYVDVDSLHIFKKEILSEIKNNGAEIIYDYIKFKESASEKFDEFFATWGWADWAVLWERKPPGYYCYNDNWIAIHSSKNGDRMILLYEDLNNFKGSQQVSARISDTHYYSTTNIKKQRRETRLK